MDSGTDPTNFGTKGALTKRRLELELSRLALLVELAAGGGGMEIGGTRL